jgi:hypothetical protein
VASIAAAYAEALEGTARRDFAIGQPKLKLCDDKLDAPNLRSEPGVVLGKGKQSHLFETLHDDFRPAHFGLVAVMGVQHRGRENPRLPQCPLDDFVHGHQQPLFMCWKQVNGGNLPQGFHAGGEMNRND